MIEPLELLDDLNGNSRLIVYPCINVVLLGDDVRELLESFREDEALQAGRRSGRLIPLWNRRLRRTMMIQQTKTDRERFVALSRICLNNWHYISRKTLSFSEEINFFTGHSGSGKSTVIDAMQIVLYANTDGRGFFNKAAADDSDRSLIEYLRGMVNIGENNEFAYLRNRNFSTTIVLELKQTDTEECQCVGIVFDVETASNEISRKFFWHKGPLWENNYRTEGRAMTIAEVEEELLRSYGKEECFYTSHNERFRRLLYDVYLGGLDQEKFPLLFKRAIPFRMNIKLEDFVKEYICMEQDIHIEDMQESVMQYGRMRRKIEDTCAEIEELAGIQKAYDIYQETEQQLEKYAYFVKKLEILDLQSQVKTLADKLAMAKEDLKRQEDARTAVETQIADLTGQGDNLLRRIASTGYEDLKKPGRSPEPASGAPGQKRGQMAADHPGP